MRQAVTFNKVWPKPPMPFGWPHQPVRSLCQLTILKDGKPGCADAHARWIGCFKIEAGDGHRIRQSVVMSFWTLGFSTTASGFGVSKPATAIHHSMLSTTPLKRITLVAG